jgi:hypothetical protein
LTALDVALHPDREAIVSGATGQSDTNHDTKKRIN